MSSEKNILIKRYFESHSIVDANLKSFNNFIENYMQNAVDAVGDIVPTIIPPEMQEFKIRFGKISVGKPVIIEADGSKRKALKGWAQYEPVIVSGTDITIGLLSLETIGAKINSENIHRLDKFIDINGIFFVLFINRNVDFRI